MSAGIAEQLDRIEEQANKLHDWAAGGMKFYRAELANLDRSTGMMTLLDEYEP